MEIHRLASTLQQYVDELQPNQLGAITKSTLNREYPEAYFELLGNVSRSGKREQHVFKSTAVIHCLRHADLLKSDGTIEKSIELSLHQILPGALLPVVLDFMHISSPPSASSISRWRFILDCAFMEVRREDIHLSYIAGNTFTRYIMYDASFQNSRDYEMMLMCSILDEDLEAAYGLVRQLFSLDRCTPTSSEYEAELAMMSTLKSYFEVHRPAPVAQGSGNTSVGSKFVTMMHQLFLDVGGGNHYL